MNPSFTKSLPFHAWTTYILTEPVFTATIGKPLQGKTGILLQLIQ